MKKKTLAFLLSAGMIAIEADSYHAGKIMSEIVIMVSSPAFSFSTN